MKNSIDSECIANEYSTIHHKIISKIIDLKENDFTKDILLPLFKTMDWLFVDFHGGPYEGGKDVILQKKDEFEDVEFCCVQVKKYKPTAKAENPNNLGLIINQLKQAQQKVIPHTDGISYTPSRVFFITPYEIDTRSLESRFEGLSDASKSRIKVIDGSKIADLLVKRLPNIVESLIDVHDNIHVNMIGSLNNKELMGALGNRVEVDLASYYCDLDFGIGRITTKSLLSLSFRPKDIRIKITDRNWPEHKKIAETVAQTNKIQLYEKTIIEIDEELKKQIAKNEASIKLIKDAEGEIERCNKEENLYEKEIQNYVREFSNALLINESNYPEGTIRNYRESFKFLFLETEKDRSKDENRTYSKIIKTFEKIITSIESDLMGKKVYLSYINKKKGTKRKLNKQKKIIDNANKKLITVRVPTKTNSQLLFRNITSYIQELKSEIESFPEDFTQHQLTLFIRKCELLLGNSENLLDIDIVQKTLGVDLDDKFNIMENSRRFKISIHDVIESGRNLLLLGEAGAGKTTTLQMYLQKYADSKDNSKIIFFLPINKLLRNFQEKESQFNDQLTVESFEFAIKYYLETLGVNLTIKDLKQIFSSKNVVLLIDGLDESISKFPKLIGVIHQFADKYQKCQLIVSSRMSGKYIDNIEFLGVTLLPFDNQQRQEFINLWFRNKQNDQSQRLLNHIEKNRELDKIIRLPLLATIFCVLAENDIALPVNELLLYDERFNLLLGLYDAQKKTNRVKSIKVNLTIISRKLAYQLHKRGLRSLKFDEIVRALNAKMSTKLSKSKIHLAVSELIDPCNILVPMSIDGEYGFGHLRYQEYLVATELINNRGINIVPLLNIPWWKESLLLFSRMTDDLEFVFNEIAKYDSFSKFNSILTEMLTYRPNAERKRLQGIIKKHGVLDTYENNIFGENLSDNFSLVDDEYNFL